jgi:hypothetical protein
MINRSFHLLKNFKFSSPLLNMNGNQCVKLQSSLPFHYVNKFYSFNENKRNDKLSKKDKKILK